MFKIATPPFFICQSFGLRFVIWYIIAGVYTPACIMSVLRTFVSRETKPRRGGIK